MPLTDTAIRNAKPTQKPYKLFDERGLYLEVSPAGGKWWRLKYRSNGKEKRLSLGVYPDVSLKDARNRRDQARKLLAGGVDPSEHRQAQKSAQVERAANSFEVVAREWYAKHAPSWADHHGERILRRLERDIFPWIGGQPIADITAPELLKVVRRIEERGALETAHRALSTCGQVFRYAVATGRAQRNPSGDLRGALPPFRGTHFAAITEPKRAGELLRMIDGYQGFLTVRCALRLAPLVFVRPGELRRAKWADIDLDAEEWRYTVTKTQTQHIVPLSRQAVAILHELMPLTGHLPGGWVFTGGRTPRSPMSNMAINAGMRRMGIDTRNEVTGHGWRAVARTFLHERLSFAPEIIEHQLAHAVPDTLGRAYNRTRFIAERRQMMQQWADYLDKLKAGADVVSFRQAG